jgi:hypothetical protein
MNQSGEDFEREVERELAGLPPIKSGVTRKGYAGKIAVSIPDHLFSHPAYKKLDSFERNVMTEMLALARRQGTGYPLNCSARMAASMCNMSKSQADRTLASLEKKGFIVSKGRGFKRGLVKIASQWRITCLPYQGEAPTRDYVRTYYKGQDKLADDAKGQPFFTPELEALLRREK